MAREIRTTKMLLDKRKDKFRDFDIKKNQLKEKLEVIEKENIELANANTFTNEKLVSLKEEISQLENKIDTLEKDVSFYLQDISDLREIREKELSSIKEMYVCLDEKISKSEQKLKENIEKSDLLHQKCVEEQSKIQRGIKDLNIYKERLQKKYDEVGLGEIKLID
jgi:chromosome segregation ATPase